MAASINTPHELHGDSESHESHETHTPHETHTSRDTRTLQETQNLHEPSLSYYQKSLLAILAAVEDAYGNILLEEELDLLARIQRLEGDAQRMFFRLYLRKVGWFRVDKLEYKDIDDCPTAISGLAEANLVELEPTEPEEMLDILQLEELKILAKSLKVQMGSAINRERVRQEILATRRSKQKRLNFGPTRRSIADEAAERIMKLGRGLAGPVVRIPPTAIESLRRIFGLFFLDSTSQEENNLSTAIMTDLNKKKYPPYVLVKSGPIFSSRSDWITYDEAIRYEKTVSEMLAGDETGDLLSDLLAVVLENWRNSYAAGQTVNSYFLRRYTAGWVYTRMLSSLVGVLEKAKNHEEANRILETLLFQDVYCLGHRGKWWERLVLNLATHIGGKAEALKKCQEALEDVHVRTGSRIALQRRLCKLTHTSFKLDEPPETMTLYADPETTRTTGRKLLYLSKQHVLVSVEDLVLEHFMDQGWRGFHCESRIYRMLFALCFWDILYGNTPDVFQTPYQTAPLDLNTDAFYRVRKAAIEMRLTQIGEGAAPHLIVESYYPFYGCQALGVLWEEYPLDALLDICHALGPALSPILRVLAEDYGHSSAGLPDLLLYRPDRSAYRLVEVKSTNDRLSDAQRNWHAVFRENQIDFVLFRVLDTHLQDC